MNKATETELIGIQEVASSFFTTETERTNGLVPDSTAVNVPSSIAAIGFALTSYLIAAERKFMTRTDALERSIQTLKFLEQSEQGKDLDATGMLGFYYHFLDMRTGKRTWASELSTIDTAILMLGVLSLKEYFQGSDPREKNIREMADRLYRRVEWNRMLSVDNALLHGWKPERGFLKWEWRGYNEALLLYVLALGSPTYAIPTQCYNEWLRSYEWKSAYGEEYLYAGPLFIHQIPQCWLDLRGLQDSFMRAHGIDYFENSRRATLIQSRYCKENPRGFEAYEEYCWGLTASDGPGAGHCPKKSEKAFFSYAARGVPDGPDDGTLAPWAAVASLPFAPELVLKTIARFDEMNLGEKSKYGFRATFNYSFPDGPGGRWLSPCHYGLNQGPIVLMIENYLTGFVWDLMKRSSYIRTGLERAGFRGGWLDKQ